MTKLSIKEVGNGQNILILIHPYPVNNDYYAKLGNFLPPSWQAILPDLPGFGQSPIAEGDIMTMSYLAEEIRSVIPDKRDKLVIAGSSMGGYITMAFAEKYREMIDGLILMNTRDLADGDGGQGRKEVVDKIQNGGREAYISNLMPKLLAHQSLGNHTIVDQVKELIATTTDEAIIQTSLGMGRRPSRREVITNLNIPILLVTGDDDAITGPEIMEEMKEAYQDASLKIVDHAGHYAAFENPQQMTKIIHKFLDNLSK